MVKHDERGLWEILDTNTQLYAISAKFFYLYADGTAVVRTHIHLVAATRPRRAIHGQEARGGDRAAQKSSISDAGFADAYIDR